MATIKIKNLRLKTVIGANESERKKKQKIIINISFDFDDKMAVGSDNLNNTVNYRTITKKVVSLVSPSRFFLLEKLADAILKIVIEDKRVTTAEVEVDKPGALRFSDSVSVVKRFVRKRGKS